MHPLHLLLAVAVMAIWGLNFVVIRIGLDGMPPILLVALRFTLAALPAVFFVKRPNVKFARIAHYGLVVFALQFALLFGGMYLGLSAGLAAVVLQMHIFFTMLLAFALLRERPTVFQLAGAVLGFLGVAIIALKQDVDAPTIGLAMVVLAAMAWAAGNMIGKQFGKVDMFAVVVWSSLAAPLPLFALSYMVEGPIAIARSLSNISLTSLLALAYLVYLSTHFGFGAWTWLLNRYPASTVVPMTLLAPVFAMTASALVLGEKLPSWKLLAAALVIAGLAINIFGGKVAAWRGRALGKAEPQEVK
ncbi:MAG: EamA family transporter [Ramlibacter sp.]|nr:EamA family transporter [Ramlibacter sp.]